MTDDKTKNLRKTCSACGTSPLNHQLLFTTNLLEETILKAGDKLFSFASTPRGQKLSGLIEKSLYNTLQFIGVLHYKNDPEKTLTGRSKLIWEEAKARGISMEQIAMFGKHLELYRAKIAGKYFYFPSLPIPPELPQSGYKWLDDKFVLLDRLSQAGIPAPATQKIVTWKSALKAFETMRKPLIIKPKYGSRGRHTTTNINTLEELKKAFDLARRITPWMVLQEHLYGSVYRATVIDGKLVGFFRADTPKVIADGVRTIHELILAQNKNHHEKISEILINDDVRNFIERLGYTLESIPKNGIVVGLSAKTGRMYGGYTREMLPEVHLKIHQIFAKAGKVVEAPVVGFDLIIEDPTKDPDTQHWGIIECNSLPFIDLHYFALEGEPVNLAKNVWDLWKTK